MGNILTMCTSCCKESTSYEDLTPDMQTRRQQQVEAAEKRRIEQEKRGIGNVDAVRRQQQLDAERQQREQQLSTANNTENPLKFCDLIFGKYSRDLLFVSVANELK
ncbi:hypothetical protein PV326_009519 [Microctonus aethiopoides]|nr:hypothetical protein PV326_009519 [Microctonus aethiopoides]